ncbi:MAG: hypothetical protein ACRCU5_07855 [Rhizobiaceae bacterium]
MRHFSLVFAATLSASIASAGEADVVDVKVTVEAGGTYNFDVTVLHADAGWKHYANKWDVVGADGKVYTTRILAHPHDDEQPFTRSQNGVVIPEGVEQVTVRANDLVHAYGGKEMTVDLPGR